MNESHANNFSSDDQPRSPSTESPHSSANQKYKSYLIEKLLNENNETAENVNDHDINHLNKHTSPLRSNIIYQKYNGGYEDNTTVHHSDPNKSPQVEADVRSEAGTYTVDENVESDIAVLDDLEFKENQFPTETSKTNVKSMPNVNEAAINVTKSLTSPSIIELASARAAIDHTFGVRRLNGSDSVHEIIMDDAQQPDPLTISESTETSKSVKRSPQKLVRERNKTYSLRKEVFDGYS